ncbi:hypothetical protein [Thalassoroseus pseudoceratinae]|uniref:hypothetical protein n=1 Tax=Thalassoroseus pseudoceratinae TaxID=2713176 RepID=UPI00141EC7C6|nr:hypothetical protein [Thalassoroseus pseudoceratinae]
MIGELLTRWTVRIAMACYIGRVTLDIAGCQSESAARWKRGLWTIGCGWYLVHVACAFMFYHNWSHAAAYEHTANQTATVTGWHWGGGLWINYAFTFAWILDCIAWWRTDPTTYPKRRWLNILTQSIFGFLVFNATVVFGPGGWIAIALGVFAWWCVLIRRRLSRKETSNVSARTG